MVYENVCMITNLPRKRISAILQWKHLSEFNPQDGGESQLESKLRHCQPMYNSASGILPAVEITSLCSASSLGCQRDTARICCCAPCYGAVAAERHHLLLIDIFCPPALSSKPATCRCCCQSMGHTNGRRDRQTVSQILLRMLCGQYQQEAQLSPRTARCVVSVEIMPIATQQCRNYLYDKSWTKYQLSLIDPCDKIVL